MESVSSSSLMHSLAGAPFFIELKPCAVSRLDVLDVVRVCGGNGDPLGGRRGVFPPHVVRVGLHV